VVQTFPKQLFMVKSERMNYYNDFNRKFTKMFSNAMGDYSLFKTTYNDNISAQTEIQVEMTQEINIIKTALEELNS
jgi:hypothetical protein